VGGQGLAGWSGQQGLSDAGEAAERDDELVGPGPACGDLDEGAAAAVDDPGGGVEESVAQQFRLGLGQGSVEQDGLGPSDQVGGGQRELQPDSVDRELSGREPAQPGLFGGADAVLDSGVGAVPGLQERKLPLLGVGGQALVPPATPLR
jgi:hypothetical protein